MSPSPARAVAYLDRIRRSTHGPTNLMEVCGTHTMAICRHGLRSMMPRGLRLLSGPGCPVCVTPAEIIDTAAAMSREPGVTLATFGDMVRVPGRSTSLAQERARGGDVRVVYSAADALDLAAGLPHRLVVFLGVGFETTSPTVAATLVRAAALGADNFLVLPAFKLIPPAMAALVEDGASRIHGFICPGHVSVVIGSTPYEPISSRFGVPCVITGFEAGDVLEGTAMLLEQRAQGRAEVEIQYARAVRREGNRNAIGIVERVFSACDSTWRGVGTIPSSGLELSPGFSRFDARTRVQVDVAGGPDLPENCSCGDVMRGLVTPPACSSFGKACTPTRPLGPCMISSEGACAAYNRYGR